MYALSTVLLVLSASALLVQAGSIPASKRNSVEETKDVNIGNNGISIKTGYEGYVASVDTQKSRKSDYFSQIDHFSKADLLTKISMLKNGLLLVGKLVMPFVFKLLLGVKFITTVLSLSFAVTYGMCSTFTSLCAFDVNMPFKKQDIEARIKSLASPYISEQTLTDTMDRVKSALGALNTIQAIQDDLH